MACPTVRADGPVRAVRPRISLFVVQLATQLGPLVAAMGGQPGSLWVLYHRPAEPPLMGSNLARRRDRSGPLRA